MYSTGGGSAGQDFCLKLCLHRSYVKKIFILFKKKMTLVILFICARNGKRLVFQLNARHRISLISAFLIPTWFCIFDCSLWTHSLLIKSASFLLRYIWVIRTIQLYHYFCFWLDGCIGVLLMHSWQIYDVYIFQCMNLFSISFIQPWTSEWMIFDV